MVMRHKEKPNESGRTDNENPRRDRESPNEEREVQQREVRVGAVVGDFGYVADTLRVFVGVSGVEVSSHAHLVAASTLHPVGVLGVLVLGVGIGAGVRLAQLVAACFSSVVGDAV